MVRTLFTPGKVSLLTTFVGRLKLHHAAPPATVDIPIHRQEPGLPPVFHIKVHPFGVVTWPPVPGTILLSWQGQAGAGLPPAGFCSLPESLPEEKNVIVLRIAVAEPKRRRQVVEVLLEKHITCCPAGTCPDPQLAAYSRDELTHRPDLSQGAIDHAVSGMIYREVQFLLDYRLVGELARADSRNDSRLAERLEMLPEQEPLF